MTEILILNNQEQPITWLKSDYVTATETSEIGVIRKLSLEVQLFQDGTDYSQYFIQGNKIWISETGDLTPCLYICNGVFEKDFTSELILVEAEEVVSELSNGELYPFSSLSSLGTISNFLLGFPLNTANLGAVLDGYYDLDSDSELPNVTIDTHTTLTRYALLLLIEEQTGYHFTREYQLNNDNTITRIMKLSEDPYETHNTVIELGYNAEDISYTTDEYNTYLGCGAVMKIADNESNSDFTSKLLNFYQAEWTQGATVNLQDPKTYFYFIIDNSNETCTPNSTAQSPPLQKDQNTWYVYDKTKYEETDYDFEEDYSRIHYKGIREQERSTNLQPRLNTVETSERCIHSVYKACYEKYLETDNPSVNIECKVQALNNLTGEVTNYCIGDTVYIQLPGYHNLIRSTVSKTVKNPDLPSEHEIQIGETIL